MKKWLKDILGITKLEEEIVGLRAIKYNYELKIKRLNEGINYAIKQYGTNDKELYNTLEKLKKSAELYPKG